MRTFLRKTTPAEKHTISRIEVFHLIGVYLLFSGLPILSLSSCVLSGCGCNPYNPASDQRITVHIRYRVKLVIHQRQSRTFVARPSAGMAAMNSGQPGSLCMETLRCHGVQQHSYRMCYEHIVSRHSNLKRCFTDFLNIATLSGNSVQQNPLHSRNTAGSYGTS